MLINLRNALMSGKRLPYDAEVEYLESTGTQWIDTGVSGAEHNLIITAGVRINTFSAYAGAFGNYASESANSFRLILAGSNNGWAYATCGYKSSNSHIIDAFSLGNWHTIVLNGAEDRCFCDGVESTKGNRYLQGTANANTIKIFTSGGSAAGTWSKQISAFKVELNGNLLRDYIPVRKGTVGYLYDRVSGALFGNAGSGDFLYGQDIVPVEYIESHGTEYIDTGVIGNSSTKVELKAQGANTSSLQVLLGGRDTNGRYSFAVWQRSTLDGAYGMRWDYLATNIGAGGGYVLDGVWNTSQPNLVVKDGANNYLNGVQLGTNASNSFSCNFPLALFAMNTGGSKGSFFVGKMFMCKISNNNTPTRNYTPVRVGTDATSWEGAMMDVLTRRVYRNAGTGAFTYGNDLRYPIPAE